MEVKNPISQNITIFPKINKKRIKKYCSLMHSILGRGSFNTKNPASVRCGMEAIGLWHC